MTELGLNAKQLSLAAGLNETYVRDLLKAEKPNPRYFHLKALAVELGVSVAWLDTGEDQGAQIIDLWDRKADSSWSFGIDAYSRMISMKNDTA